MAKVRVVLRKNHWLYGSRVRAGATIFVDTADLNADMTVVDKNGNPVSGEDLEPKSVQEEARKYDAGATVVEATTGEPDPHELSAQERSQKIAQALGQLDHGDDSHWTKSGDPRINVVEDLTGLDDITRSELLNYEGTARRTGEEED